MHPDARIQKAKRLLFGWSLILFPIMLLIGFLSHPDVTSFEITRTAQQLADKFRHSDLFHYGHLVVTFTVPVIIVAHLGLMERLRGEGAWYGLVGGLVTIFGAFILAVDKGSLCLVLSAFDTLPDAAFAQLVPSLQVIVDKAGLLWINWLLVLLPLGGVIVAIGLLREGLVAVWQGGAIILGLLLLNNPDIEIISSMGAILMIVGYVPLGFQFLKAEAAAGTT